MKNRPSIPRKVSATAPHTMSASASTLSIDPLRYVFLFLSLVPIYFYVSSINMYAVNFPYLDDYDAILLFLNKFTDAGFGEKIALLFGQHAEHRILHGRIIYVLYHYIFGEVSFVSLIWIGNLQYIGVFALLVYFIKKALPDMWYAAALILSICMFDLSNYENANFAMAGVSNFGIIFLFLLALYCFSKKSNTAFAVGLLLQFVTIFSNGNGTIASVFLVAYLAFNKQWRKTIISGVVFVACVLIYFLTLSKVPSSGDDTTNLAKMATYFVYLSGGHFGFDFVYTYNLQIGLACLVFFIAILLYRPLVLFRKESLLVVCVCGFLVGSMLSISIFRSDVKDMYHLSHSSRYLIYPHILLPLMFVFLLIKLDGKNKVRWAVFFPFAILLIVSFRYNTTTAIKGLEVENKRLRFSKYFYGWNRPEAIAKAKAIEEEACRKGIYCMSSER